MIESPFYLCTSCTKLIQMCIRDRLWAMGLIANYSCLSDANLKEIKAMGSEEEEILESVEEWNDDDELLLDIDKMWDVLHFVLTGVAVSYTHLDVYKRQPKDTIDWR